MSKRLMILVLAVAMLASFTAAAYAEVQNVKVSGDLLMQGISRRGFTLSRDTIDLGAGNAVNLNYKATGLITHARVRVDADLTDNVSATVRLLNERSWGNDGFTTSGGTLAADNTGDEVTIDLAYVTLKEFLYSPLTLTIGRQEMRFGSGLVVGDVDTNRVANEWQIPGDLSLRKSFDAARATLNYDPIVVDVIYSKIEENDIWWNQYGGTGAPLAPIGHEAEDTNLYGINMRYDLSSLGFKGATELYYFGKVSNFNSGVVMGAATGKTDTVHTIGILTYGQIIKNLTASLEGAYQFGNDAQVWGLSYDRVNASRSAWAMEFTANYDLKDINMIGKYSPKVTGIYGILSGDKSNPANNHGRTRMWDPMFEDKTWNSVVNAIFLNTNVRYAGVSASCKPIDDITLSGVYGYYWFDRTVAGAAFPTTYSGFLTNYSLTGDKQMGQAFDVTATYDYTEDVQFGLTYGYFHPGHGIDRTSGAMFDENATQLIGSMKVTF